MFHNTLFICYKYYKKNQSPESTKRSEEQRNVGILKDVAGLPVAGFGRRSFKSRLTTDLRACLSAVVGRLIPLKRKIRARLLACVGKGMQHFGAEEDQVADVYLGSFVPRVPPRGPTQDTGS